MEPDYAEFKMLLESKLPNKSLSLAVVNARGDLEYENFRQGIRKNEIIEVANQTINTARDTENNLASQFPEYMLYKGTDAFLLIMPSQATPGYYIVFCNNGLNVGMTRICVQNTISAFEKSNN